MNQDKVKRAYKAIYESLLEHQEYEHTDQYKALGAGEKLLFSSQYFNVITNHNIIHSFILDCEIMDSNQISDLRRQVEIENLFKNRLS